jgi:Fe-S oxidoreductase
VLLWVGCSGAFHPAYQQTTRDLVKLLKAGGVDFAILGPEEFCCGDPARKLGDEELFLKLAKRNIERLSAHGIAKVVTLCPHCFNTLSREYQALGCHLDVMPAVSLVDELVRGGRINLKYPLAKSLAVHDPCYLGRYNGIYEPLRQVCRSIPGVCLKELDRNREQGFCCGGGGGRMWLHETSGENINVLRAREVTAAGVDTVVTACPYCLTMLEDGVKTVDGEAMPQVRDIISLAADSLGENRTEEP